VIASVATKCEKKMDSTERLVVGMTGTETTVVTREVTVAHYHPEMPEVLGTPFMIYLMEVAASNAIRNFLPNGWVSVGYEVNIKHLAATPVGRTVTASAALTAVNGRQVSFSVEARDGATLIGTGTHVRAVVELARFEKRLRES
jgi:fluoroacetyl-CoA thioesterase